MLRYTHADHLGSASLQTDTNGNTVASTNVGHWSYGTVRTGSPTALNTDRTYTGQKQDSTGLLYYNARYYDPSLGQFLSPDTLVPDAGLVLDYNRYMYVRGNPLKYTDPTGHYTEDQIKDYLRNTYGDSWQQYWQAWQADPQWMYYLFAAQDEYVLSTAFAGNAVFKQNGSTFTLAGGKLHEYQGQGVTQLFDNQLNPVDDFYLGAYREGGTYSQMQPWDSYFQPVFNYGSGSPQLSYWREITVGHSVERKWSADGSVPAIVTIAYGVVLYARNKLAIQSGARMIPYANGIIAAWDVATLVDAAWMVTRDQVSYQGFAADYDVPGIRDAIHLGPYLNE